MILLDTNVVSELMRTSPNPAVERWIADHPSRTCSSRQLVNPNCAMEPRSCVGST